MPRLITALLVFSSEIISLDVRPGHLCPRNSNYPGIFAPSAWMNPTQFRTARLLLLYVVTVARVTYPIPVPRPFKPVIERK
jgi:hypothetical protein